MTPVLLGDLAGEADPWGYLAEQFATVMPEGAELVVAYISEGNYGCDSSAFVLYRQGGELFEVNGSHCSCYGFEGQWDPEETTREALLARTALFYTGGYDTTPDEHVAAARSAIEDGA